MIWKIPLEKFELVLQTSNSLAEALSRFELGSVNGNHKTIKARIEEENIDISHMSPYKRESRVVYALEEILIKDSPYANRTSLKKRLLKAGLLKEECYKCGIGPVWNGLPLTLQLEHKNGINNDHRLENLELICPNCHTQTDTYAGKNTRRDKMEHNKAVRKRKKVGLKCKECLKEISDGTKTNLCSDCYAKTNRKVERPSKEELLKLILTYPFTTIASNYNVSDNAVRKWCKLYGLPTRKNEIKEYIKEQNLKIIRD